MLKKITTIFLLTLSVSALFAIEPFSFLGRPQKNSYLDYSYMNTTIDEAHRITVDQDGHLFSNGKRIRIFGTNISEIPAKEDAKYWAELLARQGFNCIRFHQLDGEWTKAFMTVDYKTNKRTYYDEEALDRFDYFFAELKKVGIYSNINLLAGRRFTAEEGLPSEISKLNEWKETHALGFWDDKAFELQKEYAKWLLAHKNPYTNTKYNEDPAVVIVEINNENSLPMSYFNGTLDLYSQKLFSGLENKWNEWLAKKNLNFESLSKQINVRSPNKKEIFNTSSKGQMENGGGGKSSVSVSKNKFSIKVIENAENAWNIAYHFTPFETKKDKYYKITFSAKATDNAKISIGIMMQHTPWKNLGFSKNIKLTKNWQSFTFYTNTLTDDTNARFDFSGLGKSKGITFSIKDFSLTEGADIDFVEKEKNFITLPKFAKYSDLPYAYKKLITEFLYETDSIYWAKMNEYLKKEIKIKALTVGSIVSCAPYTTMSQFDIIDSHCYFHHPEFPEGGWSTKTFYVINESLASTDYYHNLSNLARLRVFGKPFSISEYDHPYPSQFSAEALPMLISFASFQDWDCVYSFSYSLRFPKENEENYLTSFFDQTNNPVKNTAIPIAAKIFREFLISPGKNSYYVPFTNDDELNLLINHEHSWDIIPMTDIGLSKEMNITSKTGIVLGNTKKECDEKAKSLPFEVKPIELFTLSPRDSTVFTNDTNEITWNKSKGSFTITNDDCYLSISQKDKDNNRKTSFSNKIRFEGNKDFSVIMGIKVNDDEYVFYSSSWSGGLNDNIHLYDTELENKSNKKWNIIRDVTKITSEMNHKMICLASEGKIIQEDNFSDYNLYALTSSGELGNLITKENNTWNISSNDKTLWYVLKK